jgi:hypothetical protein
MAADAMANIATMAGTIAVMTIIAMDIATMAGAGIVRLRRRIAITTMRIRRTTIGRLRRRRIVGIGIVEVDIDRDVSSVFPDALRRNTVLLA